MKPHNPEPVIIGRAEKVSFPDLQLADVPAKIDTGADVSSIWASQVRVTKDGDLSFCLFSPESPYYTGKVHHVDSKDYTLTRVANSFGEKEVRYVVKMKVRVAGKTIVGTFTLADRSQKLYPILLGRRLLKGKFVVDVKRGDPLHAEEKAKRQKLEIDLQKLSDKLGE